MCQEQPNTLHYATSIRITTDDVELLRIRQTMQCWMLNMFVTSAINWSLTYVKLLNQVHQQLRNLFLLCLQLNISFFLSTKGRVL